MTDARAQRAIEIMESIRAVLFEEWDPIGVGENQNLRDEYESSIAPVYRLLTSGASTAEVADCLSKLENDLGTRAPSQEHLVSIAQKLQALNLKLSSDAA